MRRIAMEINEFIEHHLYSPSKKIRVMPKINVIAGGCVLPMADANRENRKAREIQSIFRDILRIMKKDLKNTWVCKNCGQIIYYEHRHPEWYCPNCGGGKHRYCNCGWVSAAEIKGDV